MKLKSFKAPNTFAILFSMIIIFAVFSWIIPPGEFDREEIGGREVVKKESYHAVEANPQNIDDVLIAPLKGFIDGAQIIGFVLLVGGVFGIFQKTEAVEAGIKSIAKAHTEYRWVRKSVIPLIMILFSLAGATFGMSEEIIPFILIFVPMSLVLGYDSITGVAITFVAAGVGFAGAFLNPFTVGIAQGISDLPIFSGMTYRIIVWTVLTLVAIIFVFRYAERIKKNPKLSITFENDQKKRSELQYVNIDDFDGIDKRHKIVLLAFLTGLVVVVIGVVEYEWFINEISAVFLCTGIAVGFLGRLSLNEITDSFLNGAKALIGTAIVIALAKGIKVIAVDGKIIDTVLFNLSNVIKEFHPVISSQAMFVIQSVINFFVPSGSGQAALTMPIMAPLSDLVGVTRQTAVLAFQFGDGFTNMIIPTSAVTIGVLTLAEIPWTKWARWILPLQIILLLLGLILLIPPYLMNWQ